MTDELVGVGGTLEDLVVCDAIANEVMEKMLAGVTPVKPESWKKAWRLVAGKHLTVENLGQIFQSLLAEATEGENAKSRLAAQKMVLDLWDKLSAQEIAQSQGQPIAIQIVLNEKPKGYLLNMDEVAGDA